MVDPIVGVDYARGAENPSTGREGGSPISGQYSSAQAELLIPVFRDYLDAIPSRLNYILPQDLAQDLDRYFVLDNRTPDAFAAGHIPGAVNIWMKELLEPDQLARLPRGRPIVVCCWVGHTASQLLPILSTLGFDVIGLKYGMGSAKDQSECRLGWVEQGLPVETSVDDRR